MFPLPSQSSYSFSTETNYTTLELILNRNTNPGDPTNPFVSPIADHLGSVIPRRLTCTFLITG
jgi:hypothetical protein